MVGCLQGIFCIIFFATLLRILLSLDSVGGLCPFTPPRDEVPSAVARIEQITSAPKATEANTLLGHACPGHRLQAHTTIASCKLIRPRQRKSNPVPAETAALPKTSRTRRATRRRPMPTLSLCPASAVIRLPPEVQPQYDGYLPLGRPLRRAAASLPCERGLTTRSRRSPQSKGHGSFTGKPDAQTLIFGSFPFISVASGDSSGKSGIECRRSDQLRAAASHSCPGGESGLR